VVEITDHDGNVDVYKVNFNWTTTSTRIARASKQAIIVQFVVPIKVYIVVYTWSRYAGSLEMTI
jgi:hypothetical protein